MADSAFFTTWRLSSACQLATYKTSHAETYHTVDGGYKLTAESSLSEEDLLELGYSDLFDSRTCVMELINVDVDSSGMVLQKMILRDCNNLDLSATQYDDLQKCMAAMYRRQNPHDLQWLSDDPWHHGPMQRLAAERYGHDVEVEVTLLQKDESGMGGVAWGERGLIKNCTLVWHSDSYDRINSQAQIRSAQTSVLPYSRVFDLEINRKLTLRCYGSPQEYYAYYREMEILGRDSDNSQLDLGPDFTDVLLMSDDGPTSRYASRGSPRKKHFIHYRFEWEKPLTEQALMGLYGQTYRSTDGAVSLLGDAILHFRSYLDDPNINSIPLKIMEKSVKIESSDLHGDLAVILSHESFSPAPTPEGMRELEQTPRPFNVTPGTLSQKDASLILITNSQDTESTGFIYNIMADVKLTIGDERSLAHGEGHPVIMWLQSEQLPGNQQSGSNNETTIATYTFTGLLYNSVHIGSSTRDSDSWLSDGETEEETEVDLDVQDDDIVIPTSGSLYYLRIVPSAFMDNSTYSATAFQVVVPRP